MSTPLRIEPVKIQVSGKQRVFDICDPKLPDWIDDNDLSAGDYPYDEKLSRKLYEKQLEALHQQSVKMQAWLKESGARVMCIFEGRDAAGKGGTIAVLRRYLNPRIARNVALSKPTETERGQWYFQRYVAHLPTVGEFVTFDRSWYNRGGVEPVMGFCTPEQHKRFLEEAPHFEKRLVQDGIYLFKFWLNIGQETQLKRFHDRVHDPLKYWKFSPMDVAGMERWEDYSTRRNEMINATHSDYAPWTIIKANDKRRLRLEVLRHVLDHLPYNDKDKNALGIADGSITGSGPAFL